MSSWFIGDLGTLPRVVLSALGFYVVLIVVIRIVGLRSLSKMSSYDFILTVAAGSLMATTRATGTPSLLQGVVGLGTLFAIQKLVSKFRVATGDEINPFDNEPLLLMDRSGMIEANMRSASVTEDDLIAKLREANVLHLGQIRAVVLETTGDMSVLHGDEDGPDLDQALLQGVRLRPGGEPG